MKLFRIPREHHEPHDGGRRRHTSLAARIFMLIGIITVLYLLITYGLMPLLAMMTVS